MMENLDIFIVTSGFVNFLLLVNLTLKGKKIKNIYTIVANLKRIIHSNHNDSK